MFSKNSLSDSKLLLVVNLVFTESKNLERIDTDDEGSDEDEDGLERGVHWYDGGEGQCCNAASSRE